MNAVIKQLSVKVRSTECGVQSAKRFFSPSPLSPSKSANTLLQRIRRIWRVKLLFSLSIFLLSSFPFPLSSAFAQDTQLTLPDALATSNRSAVVTAQLALNDATVALSRTQADPLALRLEQTQAQQKVALSQAQLDEAKYKAIQDITSGYTQLLEAQAALNLSTFARDLSHQNLQITTIRRDKGSATELEVQEAQNALEDAENNLASAEQGVALAKTNLEGLIGMPVLTLAPIPDESLVPLPALETVLANLDKLPTLLQVNQGIELAQLGVDLLDPSYASKSQIDTAQLQLETAQTSSSEVRRGLELQARTLYNQASTASETLSIRQDALSNALEREGLEKQRLDAGLIADIQYKQTQLATKQAELAALQAKHAYLNALLALQAGTMTPLEGLYGF
jgi:outer membrane protein, heavy metal efflux system